MEILTDYWWVLAIAAGAVLIPYVLMPLVIRMTLTLKAEPELNTFPVDHQRLPRELAAHFRRATRELGPLGLEAVVGVALPRQTPRVKAVLVLFVNRQTKDAAAAIGMYADTPEGTTLQTAYVEIVTRFRDGTVVQTNNTEEMSAFPERPGFITGRFPMVKDAARLYRLHQALCERANNTSGKVLRLDEDFRGDAQAFLSSTMVAEMDDAAAAGYLYRSEREKLYRPTWPGAFIMTWQELWPFKSIRKARRDRKARQLLADLESSEA